MSKKMTSELKDLLQGLHKILAELELKLEITVKYKANKFYQKKFIDSLRELRVFKLRLEKESRFIKNSKLALHLKSIIDILNRLTGQKQILKENILDLINELNLKLQEVDVLIEDSDDNLEKIYDLGKQFDFYVDVKEIINQAADNVFIVDSWIDGDLLEVYVKQIIPSLNIRILTNSNNGKGNFLKVWNIFKSQHKNVETRESPNIHDRAVFYDDNTGFVIGQSIKDAAKNKPTYLIKLRNPNKLKSIYEKIWLTSKKIQ